MTILSTPQDTAPAIFAAMGNPKRMQIMTWIHDPTTHFPAQRDGDLIEDGVCVGAIVKKLEVSQPTVTAHMKILADAGLVMSKKIKQWTFYKLNVETLYQAEAELKRLSSVLG